MVELNEKCLDHIFGFLTPVEWIRIAEVCRLWKTLVQKQWEKIVSITQIDYRFFGFTNNLTVIPIGVAEKIISHSAQFCNTVQAFSFCDDLVVVLGRFKYRAKELTRDRVLQLLTENAKEIRKLQFLTPPKIELLQHFFRINKIKDLHIEVGSHFWQYISTDTIEALHLGFSKDFHDDNTISFKGHFQNVRELEIAIQSLNVNRNVQKLLSRTVPYVPGIKTLKVRIETSNPLVIVWKNIIKKSSQLEELFLQFDWPATDDSESIRCLTFNEELDTSSFSKLRAVTLRDFNVGDKAMLSILSLPNLEKLNVTHLDQGLLFLEYLPEMNKLTECTLEFGHFMIANVKLLSEAVKRMPNLRKLCVRRINEEQTLELTSAAIMAATRQGNDVIIEQISDDDDYDDKKECKKLLKVESKKSGTAEVLHLKFVNVTKRKFFNSISKLVRKERKSHRLVKLEDY